MHAVVVHVHEVFTKQLAGSWTSGLLRVCKGMFDPARTSFGGCLHEHGCLDQFGSTGEVMDQAFFGLASWNNAHMADVTWLMIMHEG